MSQDPYEIGPDEDLVTPQRLAKGDIKVVRNARGCISRAIPANLTIIKELIRRDIFPHYYEIYGVGFLDLQRAHRSPWAVRSSAVLLEQWGIGVSEGRAGDVYMAVMRIVPAGKLLIVEHVLSAPKEEERHDRHQDYRNSFEHLIEVMDTEQQRLLEEFRK